MVREYYESVVTTTSSITNAIKNRLSKVVPNSVTAFSKNIKTSLSAIPNPITKMQNMFAEKKQKKKEAALAVETARKEGLAAINEKYKLALEAGFQEARKTRPNLTKGEYFLEGQER